MTLPSAKVPTTPPTCSIDPITAASDTDAPRSLSTVGSQFGEEIDVEQAHEEHDPEQQRHGGPPLAEQMQRPECPAR